MQFSLSTRDYDQDGHITLSYIPSQSRLGEITRRRTRTRTLNGGFSTEDRGFALQDRKFELAVKHTPEIAERLKYLWKNYPELYLHIDKEIYRVSIVNISELDQNTFLLPMDVEEQLV